MKKLNILAALGFALSACTSVPDGSAPVPDPYEATNRQIFEFNLTIDRTFLKPTAEHYQSLTPEELRDTIRNFLDNLSAPEVFANDVLQGETRRAGQTAGRFLVNSTIGLGGLVNVSARMGIPMHDEDFGQTLAVWGVSDGAYLVLPMLGPSTPRDAAGQVVDLALDPTNWIPIKGHIFWIAGRKYVSIVDDRTRNLEAFDAIERDSLDFYAAVRSLYLQHKASEIRNGTPEP